MTRTLTCILCPRGCTLTVSGDGTDFTVSGNSCPRGEKYGIEECTHPVRTVTSSVRVNNRENTMVCVKTATPIAKEDIFTVMKHIRAAQAAAPIQLGDVLLRNIGGTDIIATRSVK